MTITKRNTKGIYHQLFNFLSQLLKAKKGAKGHWKEITFFLMKLYTLLQMTASSTGLQTLQTLQACRLGLYPLLQMTASSTGSTRNPWVCWCGWKVLSLVEALEAFALETPDSFSSSSSNLVHLFWKATSLNGHQYCKAIFFPFFFENYNLTVGQSFLML